MKKSIRMLKATFDQIRKKLGFLESMQFNLERGKRAAITEFAIDWMVAKAVGKQWYDRSEEKGRDRSDMTRQRATAIQSSPA